MKRFGMGLLLVVVGMLMGVGNILATTPQVAAGSVHTIGLKADGTVVAVGG